jgi:phosphatidylserine decarboxylase
MLAGEGWPYLIVACIAGAVVYEFFGVAQAAPIFVVGLFLFFLFRDPQRAVPPEPLAVIAPVDGTVVEVRPCHDGLVPGEWLRIAIRVDHMGAYTVRAPIEGAIQSIAAMLESTEHLQLNNGMWLRSEEAHDVVLTFPRRFPPFGPKSFVRYGERVGQGQRFAYLRLAPRAEVYVPTASNARVAKGDTVLAGETIIADLPG